MDGYVLMLATVLRELGKNVWQTRVSKRLKQSVDAVSAFSPAGLGYNGDMGPAARCR